MRASGFPTAGAMRPENRAGPQVDPADDAGGFRAALYPSTRGALYGRATHGWKASFARAGSTTRLPGLYLAGGSVHPGPGDADGGAVGAPGGDAGDAGPCFDQEVEPGGYAWWYVDAISDDRRYGLTVIAFVGSVFSPYYAWAGRRDPLDHCAFNVALYGPRGSLWAMTERRRSAVQRSRDALAIGRTTATWNAGALSFAIDETAAPIPRPIRGRVGIRAAINQLPGLCPGAPGTSLVAAARPSNPRHG